MILIDAVFINVGGGKILLDYLVEEFEATGRQVTYLLDNRIKGNHSLISNRNDVFYIQAGLKERGFFYRKHGRKFSKILCFGNMPPPIRTHATVYTYFHQLLYLRKNSEMGLLQRCFLYLKKTILKQSMKNSDFWLVQSEEVKQKFLQKFGTLSPGIVKVMPFYPALKTDFFPPRSGCRFLYVSAGYKHKNHQRLLQAFVRMYDTIQKGELHLTVGNESTELQAEILKLKSAGYPVFNHGTVSRKELAGLYASSGYVVYPSLAESFGLGVIEAIENGCKLITSDLPWAYAVCQPSLTFDPNSIESIANAMHTALTEKIPFSKQLIFNQISELLNILQ